MESPSHEPIRITCSCGKVMEVAPHDIGKELTCPSCKKTGELTPDQLAVLQNRINRDAADGVSNDSLVKTLKAEAENSAHET